MLVAIIGNLCVASVVLSIVLLLLPRAIVSRSKLLRRLRARLLKFGKRMAELSVEGPFYRLFVWCGRKGARGRLASLCRPPLAPRARAVGWNEVVVTWSPQIPVNPFHEENYVLAWRVAKGEEQDAGAAGWRERSFDRHSDCEELEGKTKLRVYHGQLPELTPLVFRIRAVNARGHGEWSDEVEVTTLAKPSDAGGFTGPLGPASDGCGQYTWTQTQSEVGLKIPIGPTRKAKDFKVKVLATRLEVRCAASVGEDDEVLVGSFPKRVKVDEANWQIEDTEADGRHIALQMVKAEVMEKWPCLIDDKAHPRIDTRLLRFYTGMGGFDFYE